MKRINVVDGRTIEYLVEGVPDGLPLVFHHGTPVAGVRFRPLFDAAIERGMRVIAHSRPGYGGSTRHTGRRIADVAADVATILDAEGVDHFVTLGWSGGGPHALACAALMPGRCLGAVAAASFAPYGVSGLDFLADMGAGNIEGFGVAVRGAVELDKWLNERVAGVARVQPEELAERFGDNLSATDRKALTGEIAEYVAEASRYAVSAGVAGWLEDDLAFVTDWGFAVGAIQVPIAVWQGGQDRFTPFGHGRWLATHVPGAEAHLFPERGHFELMADPGPILDRLMAQATS